MNKPFLLEPAAKDYLWGGSRLNDDFHLNVLIEPFAEAWVCSTHPDGQSTVKGALLGDVLAAHPEWLGEHVLKITDGKPELPIIIKLIDANTDLSVQVHPDDEYAIKHEGQRGKTEMWYVLASRKDSRLIYGLKRDMNPEQIKKAIFDGCMCEYLNYVPVFKDDVFFIESGTIHAIGAGCLIAEIQENSNVTYRLYDYNRKDKRGQKRLLHIDKALETANLKSSMPPRQPMRVLKYQNGSASELLTSCQYFRVDRLIINSEDRKIAKFRTGGNSFHALLCIDGCGLLYGDNDVMLRFYKGDCIFIPADSMELMIHGKAQLLDVSC
jgi:mannose-6-phosphate isomerase